ncbi:MAG: energy transducer TonB [Gammaproteobacteria bacterium]
MSNTVCDIIAHSVHFYTEHHCENHVNNSRTLCLGTVISLIIFFIGSVFIATTARAELRCDCSQIVDTCSAEVGYDDNEIEIESSSDACSRVDYLINGQPYSALVVDGETEFNWDGQPQNKPQIIVENCRVCADRQQGTFAAATAPANDDTAAAEDNDPNRAIIKVLPDYPRNAWSQSLEGSVTVSFDVNEAGQVQNMRITDSSSQVFVNNTLDAVSRYRYAAGTSRSIKERFDFRLLDGITPVVNSSTLQ